MLSKPINKMTFVILLIVIASITGALAFDPDMPDSIIVGNLDSSPIIAAPGEIVTIPVWLKNDENVIAVYVPIAIDDQYIFADSGGNAFGILDSLETPHWDFVSFTNNFSDRPTSGYTSYPFAGFSEEQAPYYWYPINTDSTWAKIIEFTLVINPDPSIIGDTIDIIEGENPIIGGAALVEDDEIMDIYPAFVGGTIEIVEPGYEYLPGDANISAGIWPPAVIGSDVTYLMNYFRGITPGCDLNGFYCSGDANGDCQVIGNDVTALLNYTRGLGPISYCEDYPPAWPTSGDLPPNPPEGWPNCDGMAAAKVIPGEPNLK